MTLAMTVGAHAASNTWTGILNKNWDTTTANWTNPPIWTNGEDGVFEAQGVGTLIIAGGVTAHNLTFNATGYTITGSALTLNGAAPTISANPGVSTVINCVLAGSGGLIKAGEGALILSAANTYGGGTSIAQGTLQLGDGGSTGSITGNVTNNATLIFNRLGTVTFPGIISGSGTLTKDSPGTLILTGTSTYSGGTTVSGGTLIVNGSLAGSGMASVLPGAQLGGIGSIAGPVMIPPDGILEPGHGGIGTLTTGSLVLTGTYACELSGTTHDQIAVGGDLDLTGAILDISTLNPLTAPEYVIATYSGTLTGTHTTTGLPSGYTVDYTVPGQVRLILTGMLTFGPGAVITGDNIVWTLPCGTDVTALAPTYTLSPQTTGDPPSGTLRDFSTPQTYTVYDVTQTIIRTYTVTVKLQGPPQPFLLFNTGVDANSLVLAAGTVDPHFTLTVNPNGGGTNAFAINAVGGWLANTTASKWISPSIYG
jgi:autotransporter-associated beta strand protein